MITVAEPSVLARPTLRLTHALEPLTQGAPRQLTIALCGAYVRIAEDAGHGATCQRCQAILEQLQALEP